MSKQQLVNPEEPEQEKVYPKIFIGIPTGPPKLYSTYIMIAALTNVDYPNLEIHWAVTGGSEHPDFQDYLERLTQMCAAVKWNEGVTNHIHYVPLTIAERNTNFCPILRNKTVLRDKFLDGDAEYFLLLGGDNPPPRKAIKRLLKVDADVSMGTCFQRPKIDKRCGYYPLVWRYSWLPSDLDKFPDLEPRNLEELQLAWLSAPSMINVVYDPNWRRHRTVWNVTGGDGCALIKRRVLEMIDWGVVPSKAFHSEDIHFMGLCLWHGFTTAVATDLHIPHFDPDGKCY